MEIEVERRKKKREWHPFDGSRFIKYTYAHSHRRCVFNTNDNDKQDEYSAEVAISIEFHTMKTNNRHFNILAYGNVFIFTDGNWSTHVRNYNCDDVMMWRSIHVPVPNSQIIICTKCGHKIVMATETCLTTWLRSYSTSLACQCQYITFT